MDRQTEEHSALKDIQGFKKNKISISQILGKT